MKHTRKEDFLYIMLNPFLVDVAIFGAVLFYFSGMTDISPSAGVQTD